MKIVEAAEKILVDMDNEAMFATQIALAEVVQAWKVCDLEKKLPARALLDHFRQVIEELDEAYGKLLPFVEEDGQNAGAQEATAKESVSLQAEFEKAYDKIRGIELVKARGYAATNTEYRHEIELDERFFNAGFLRGQLMRRHKTENK